MARKTPTKEILECIQRLEEKIDRKLETHEYRLDRIERFQSYIKGMGYIIVTAVGFLAAWLIKHF